MKSSIEAKKTQPLAEDPAQAPARRNDTRTTPVVEVAATASEQGRVPVDLLDDNPDQPRQYIDPDYIAELAETILQRGLIHRIVVRRQGARFQVVAGHRRRDAYKKLLARGAPGDWTTIPADIVQVTDEQSALHCLLENIEREDLSAAEEGAAYAGLIAKYGLTNAKELAGKLGIDEQRVARRLRINEGPDCIKQALTRGLKVPLPDADDGSRKRNETRRLSFHGALEFLKVYEHHRRKNPGTQGGRPDGRPVADIKTEPMLVRALSEGWSRQRIQVEVERTLNGKPTPTVDEASPPAPPFYEQKADRFVVFTQRAIKGTAAEREAIVSELRKALAALPAAV